MVIGTVLDVFQKRKQMACNGVLPYYGSTGESNNKSTGEADPLLRITNHDVKHADENKGPDKTNCQPSMVLLINICDLFLRIKQGTCRQRHLTDFRITYIAVLLCLKPE